MPVYDHILPLRTAKPPNCKKLNHTTVTNVSNFCYLMPFPGAKCPNFISNALLMVWAAAAALIIIWPIETQMSLIYVCVAGIALAKKSEQFLWWWCRTTWVWKTRNSTNHALIGPMKNTVQLRIP